jgi:hypothetical protein
VSKASPGALTALVALVATLRFVAVGCTGAVSGVEGRGLRRMESVIGRLSILARISK